MKNLVKLLPLFVVLSLPATAHAAPLCTELFRTPLNDQTLAPLFRQSGNEAQVYQMTQVMLQNEVQVDQLHRVVRYLKEAGRFQEIFHLIDLAKAQFPNNWRYFFEAASARAWLQNQEPHLLPESIPEMHRQIITDLDRAMELGGEGYPFVRNYTLYYYHYSEISVLRQQQSHLMSLLDQQISRMQGAEEIGTLLFRQAEISHRLGNLEDALEYARRSLEIDPGGRWRPRFLRQLEEEAAREELPDWQQHREDDRYDFD
jgi:tetratricopeptide (TPR) repeat protein